MDLEVRVSRLAPDAVIPTYAHHGDAGADISANEDVEIAPGQRHAVSTGIAIALPDGFVALLHPRSGLALKNGIGMVNAPGTIDAGYRGEIKVLLINHDPANTFTISKGDRIAQMVVAPVSAAQFRLEETLDETERGAKGFGSTGRSVG